MERVKNSEISKWLTAIGLAGALGWTALVVYYNQPTWDKDNEASEVDSMPPEVPTIDHEYYPSGVRITTYVNDNKFRSYSHIHAQCDGFDLLEQTQRYDGTYGASGNDINRSVDHSACADGKLTESDFVIPQ